MRELCRPIRGFRRAALARQSEPSRSARVGACSIGRSLAASMVAGLFLLASAGAARADSHSGADAQEARAQAGLSDTEGPVGRQILVTVEQAQEPPPSGAGSSAGAYDGAPVYSLTERTRRTIRRLARDYGLERGEGWPIRPLDVYCVVYDVPAGNSIPDLVARLEDDPRVESAQAMNRFELQADYDDPYVEMQHGMGTIRVWDTHSWSEGRGVTVAVVDTAVDRKHPDLAGTVVLARDFVGHTGYRRPHAERHGTAVAGIIASVANNGIGTVGVAPAARILALRACWQPDDPAASGSCNSFTLAKALAFVVERRPQVVNLSLAGPPDALLERLIRAALEDDVAVVTARRGDAAAEAFPASIEGVLSVASDAAPSIGGSREPPLAAPGKDILAAAPGGGFEFVSGSSFAAAHVSGVLALLLEQAPSANVQRLSEALRSTSRAVPAGGSPAALLVDACAALDRVVQDGRCAGSAAPAKTAETTEAPLNR